MAKLGVGYLDQRRLCTKGNSEACLLNHHLVVGAIADGQDVLRFSAQAARALR